MALINPVPTAKIISPKLLDNTTLFPPPNLPQKVYPAANLVASLQIVIQNVRTRARGE